MRYIFKNTIGIIFVKTMLNVTQSSDNYNKKSNIYSFIILLMEDI